MWKNADIHYTSITEMTWDILPNNEDKPELFRLWIKRVYLVSSILSIPYNELWNMTETEFLELEKISKEELSAQEKKYDELKQGALKKR